MTSDRPISFPYLTRFFRLRAAHSAMGTRSRRMPLLFAALLCATAGHAAGDREVRGRITDQQGRPVPQAVVTVRGTGRHALTDSAGVYKLGRLAGQQALTVSAIGYRQLTHALKSRQTAWWCWIFAYFRSKTAFAKWKSPQVGSAGCDIRLSTP